ncbi:MAG: electron transport complex subunit RsxC [Bacteroidetes bacterium]|nr:electron transport complex subunit RsxC [Bacteroidota bacterium]
MLKRFKKGGIHPHDNKITRAKAIEVMPLPKVAVISMAQHIGAPASPVVKRGDIVKVGQLIGQAKGFISANIHSSVSGTVKSVGDAVNSMGLLVPSVTITVDGDEWLETIDRSEEIVEKFDLSPKEIVSIVASTGIVGLGGATFPSNVKHSIPEGKTAKALVVNGVECEPYLTADHRLMLEHGREIVVAIKIICHAIGVEKAYIGIENNKLDAIESMTKASADTPIIEVVPLRVQYPQGSEKQLIEATMGAEVPSGALPIQVGAVVQNIGTMYAIYQAVQKHKPLFERVVTVTGKSVSEPKNLLTRVGSPVNDMIEYCGGVPEGTAKVIDGGPMMGRSMANLSGVINKGSSGILMMPETETPANDASSCIRCGKCVQVCPMGLEPYLLNVLADKRNFEECIEHSAMDCIECGSCSFTCPAHIRLLDNIRIAKREVGKILRNRK